MTNEDQIITRALEILASRIHSPEATLTNPADVASYLKLRFSLLEHEVFAIMLLNSQHGVIDTVELFRGTIDGAAVYPREVVKLVLDRNAAAVIFTHNHPSGVAEPSQADKRITQRLIEAMTVIDVRVLDHVIVGGSDHYSFAERGLL